MAHCTSGAIRGSVSCSRTLRQGIELATFWLLNDCSTTVPLSPQLIHNTPWLSDPHPTPPHSQTKHNTENRQMRHSIQFNSIQFYLYSAITIQLSLGAWHRKHRNSRITQWRTDIHIYTDHTDTVTPHTGQEAENTHMTSIYTQNRHYATLTARQNLT